LPEIYSNGKRIRERNEASMRKFSVANILQHNEIVLTIKKNLHVCNFDTSYLSSR